jgi:hypothetical protein
MSLSFVYLDEFGHIGPYLSRSSPKFNESPVFGLGGIILPERSVRPFATKFLQLKEYIFAKEIANSRRHASLWEKKGNEVFNAKTVGKYPHVRSTGFRLLNYIRDSGGRVFYYGREKILGTTDGNPSGLHTTVLSHAIRQLERHAADKDTNYALILDEHTAHETLIVSAMKTMYGERPARRLISPPFEVRSVVNQNMQAADWIAAIVGRLAAVRAAPTEFSDYHKFKMYFEQRIEQAATHSTVLPRR